MQDNHPKADRDSKVTEQTEANEVVQVAALPWRRRKGKIEVCLVTSRRTARWILPKGWPETGQSHARTAAQEAWEEAGLRGDIRNKLFTSFQSQKYVSPEEELPVRMEVYLLDNPKQAKDWPERGEREIKWCTIKQAIDLARDEGLAEVLKDFNPK